MHNAGGARHIYKDKGACSLETPALEQGEIYIFEVNGYQK